MRAVLLALACVGAALADSHSALRGTLDADFVQAPFLGLGGAYNPSAAKSYMYLAAAAYCSPSAIQAWNCGPCKAFGSSVVATKIISNSAFNLQAIVGKMNTNQVFVSFRGTVATSLKDWVVDLASAFMTNYTRPGCPGCKVTDGFYKAYLALQPGIFGALQEYNPDKSKQVLVTGHSLGAAMGVLCSFDLAVNGYRVPELYNFGQPRVAADEFHSTFLKKLGVSGIFRLVHYADVVPHLPPQFLGFKHMPTEVWYTEDQTSYKLCDASGEDPNCSDSLPLPVSIPDHLNYLGYAISGSC